MRPGSARLSEILKQELDRSEVKVIEALLINFNSLKLKTPFSSDKPHVSRIQIRGMFQL